MTETAGMAPETTAVDLEPSTVVCGSRPSSESRDSISSELLEDQAMRRASARLSAALLAVGLVACGPLPMASPHAPARLPSPASPP